MSRRGYSDEEVAIAEQLVAQASEVGRLDAALLARLDAGLADATAEERELGAQLIKAQRMSARGLLAVVLGHEPAPPRVLLAYLARLAAQLLEQGQHGKFSNEVRWAFGMLSARHAQVMAEAIRDGRFRHDDAIVSAFSSEELNRRLGAARDVTLTLEFRTTDHFSFSFVRPDFAPPTTLVFDEALPITTSKARAFEVGVTNAAELRAIAHLSTEWLDATIVDGSVLYDVGANVGMFGLYASRIAAGVKVVAFEPDPANLARLTANILRNRARDIIAFPLALSDTDGATQFGLSMWAALGGGGMGHVGLRVDDPALGRQLVVHRIGAVVRRLDTLRAEAPFLPAPTHIKIDVDGVDLQVLRGAAETLRAPTLRHLMVEADASSIEGIVAFLSPFGFRRTDAASPRSTFNATFARS